MAGNADFDAILSTTLKNYIPKLTDNIFSARPLFYALTNGQTIRRISGGQSIVVPIIYGTNSTAGSYAGTDTIDITAQTGISAAEYDWGQYAATVTINGLEEAQNNGEAEIIDLLEVPMSSDFPEVVNVDESLNQRLAYRYVPSVARTPAPGRLRSVKPISLVGVDGRKAGVSARATSASPRNRTPEPSRRSSAPCDQLTESAGVSCDHRRVRVSDHGPNCIPSTNRALARWAPLK